MSYDPYEHLDEVERNEWAVRQQLYARRRLAQGEVDWREKNRKMLARVEPKSRFCCRCGIYGVRMVAITGDWFCKTHDPLARPSPTVTKCCGLEELVDCKETEGPWGCTAGLHGHAKDHTFYQLRGDP